MSIRSLLSIALVATALAAAPAVAGEARASGNVPVYEGPGSRYDIIDRLENGKYYEVEECTRRERWCLVSDDGVELGWVRGSSIIGAAAKMRVTPFEFLFTPYPFNEHPLDGPWR
jgi:uncharacterized protein YraI